MSTDEQDFITNALRVCQDVQNRFYSECITVGDVAPQELRWRSKIFPVARNAELFMKNMLEEAD